MVWGFHYNIVDRSKAPLLLASLLSFAYSLLVFLLTAPRTHRDFLAPVYNLFNLP